MQYLCLINENEQEWQKMPKSEAEKVMVEFFEYTESIRKSGHYVGGNALQPTHTATTDGPFAETKELIAGYTLIKVKSREEALAWTRRFPNPHMFGGDCLIEVRQLFELEVFGESETLDRFRDIGVGTAEKPS